MSHLIKKIFFSFAFILFLFPNNVLALVSPTKEFYVNDYANILSDETEKYIINKSHELEKVDGTQIVVVTVKDLEDLSIEDYSYKLFNNFGIGNKEKQNGLLLLLSLKERKFRVEVGNGLEGILPDGKTGRFQDEYIIPYLKDNNWDKGIVNGYNAFYNEIVKLNNLNINVDSPINVNKNEVSNLQIILIFIGFFSGIILYFVFKAISFKYTWLYFLIILILSFFIPLIFIHLFGFIISVMISSGNFFIGSGSGSSGGFGGFSGGGFSGGGGSSSGGGSSRGF